MLIYMLITAVLGWFGLVLEFFLMMHKFMGDGMSPVGALIKYCSYFTIIINTMVTLGLTTLILKPKSFLYEFYSRPTVKARMSAYIIIVGVAYYFLLAKLYHLTGLDWLGNLILHDVMPVLYVGFWLIFVKKGELRWGDATKWLTFPLIYFFYILVRGALCGLYPYPFIDVNVLGYTKVVITALILVVVFWATSLFIVLIDRAAVRFAGPSLKS